MADWRARRDEVVALAPTAEEPAVAARLLELLLDTEDTAVSQAAAEALLERNDTVALSLIARAFEAAQDDTRNKLNDCLYDEDGSRWARVQLMLASLPEAAGDLAEHMAREERTHRR